MVTVVNAAAELGVTPGAVRLAMYDNRLPFQEFYGRKLIARVDLDTYRQRTQPDGVKKTGRPRKGSEEGRSMDHVNVTE